MFGGREGIYLAYMLKVPGLVQDLNAFESFAEGCIFRWMVEKVAAHLILLIS